MPAPAPVIPTLRRRRFIAIAKYGEVKAELKRSEGKRSADRRGLAMQVAKALKGDDAQCRAALESIQLQLITEMT